MDYRDNRQRWAESHQVVHFYAGQWCTFTPALTPGRPSRDAAPAWMTLVRLSTRMWAFTPKNRWLSFRVWYISASGARFLFLVEGGALTIEASTMITLALAHLDAAVVHADSHPYRGQVR